MCNHYCNSAICINGYFLNSKLYNLKLASMKKIVLYFFISTVFFNSQFIYPQVELEKGIHQEQREAFARNEKTVSKFDKSGKGIIPLQKNQVKALSKIVFGFLPDWEYNDGAHNNLHYDLLSHLAVFNFLASSVGNLSNPSGWPWTDVINASHTNGVKVIMTVTNFGGSDAAADVAHSLMTNTTAKNNLFSKIKSIISTYQLDGVNIDFDGMNVDDRGDVVNNFMADLTSYIHTNLPGKEISFDGPAVNWSGWKLDGLTQSVDHVFIMAYDYHGGWSDNTGAVSPLTGGSINLTNTLNQDKNYNIPKSKYPEKLILGVPYYGKHWKTATNNAGSSVTSYIGSTFYIDDITNSASHGGYIWDNASQTTWYRWNSGGWHQVWSDNETSLSKKYDLALAENLGGIGIWALNYDGNRSKLWDLIDKKFNGALSVDKNYIKQNIHLFPNPSDGLISISNPNFIKIKRVEVCNIYGQKLSSKYNDIQIDLNYLVSGVYIVKIEDENGKQGAFKVIKH